MHSFREIIDNELARVLKEWALMQVQSAKTCSDLYDPSSSVYIATIEFRGVVSGGYTVICQPAFVEAVAANLSSLGLDPSQVSHQDIINDMINVLSGNLLKEMYGDDTRFELSTPQLIQSKTSALSEYFEDTTRVCCYLGDGQPIAMTFWLAEIDGCST